MTDDSLFTACLNSWEYTHQRLHHFTCNNMPCVPVKDAGRDFTYLIVVLIGLGVTGECYNFSYKHTSFITHMSTEMCVCVLGGLLYVVFQELFSSSSPNKVYGKAFDKVRSHPEVMRRWQKALQKHHDKLRAASDCTLYCRWSVHLESQSSVMVRPPDEEGGSKSGGEFATSEKNWKLQLDCAVQALKSVLQFNCVFSAVTWNTRRTDSSIWDWSFTSRARSQAWKEPFTQSQKRLALLL